MLTRTPLCTAEKETPYSLRMQIYLKVQSASLVLNGPNDSQVKLRPICIPPAIITYAEGLTQWLRRTTSIPALWQHSWALLGV